MIFGVIRAVQAPVGRWIEKGDKRGQMKKKCEPTFSIGFCASLYEPYGVFDELPAGLNKLHYLIHGVWAADKTKNSNVSGVQAWAAFSADVDFSSLSLHGYHNVIIVNILHIFSLTINYYAF